ncbi:MAG TPA: hypothetical protein VFO28_04500, partial [Burkholderiaceae bacterium]|nr:hypothetical protein [Burkholderiaceae bacterium]
MKAARRTPTAAESLMRWLAAWLALAVCAQAFAVGAAALHGFGHRHGGLAIDAKPMVLWRHAGDRAPTRDAHVAAHATGEAHEHAAGDASVLGADAHAAALAALVSAPAPRVSGALSVATHDLRHVWSATDPWSPTARAVAPP